MPFCQAKWTQPTLRQSLDALHIWEGRRWIPADHSNKTFVGTAATLVVRFTHKWYNSGYEPAFPHDSGRVPARADAGVVCLVKKMSTALPAAHCFCCRSGRLGLTTHQRAG